MTFATGRGWRLRRCTAVLAHGAGSDSGFLSRAFPADRLGVASCRYLDDRTGDIRQVVRALAEAASGIAGDVIVGGVSLGAHAAGLLLADGPAANVTAGMLCMPAWTGEPDHVAGMTAAAAEAVAGLGAAAVIAELDPEDWVPPLLRSAWSQRTDEALVTELTTASRQSAPDRAALRRISVPVAVVGLSGDPLHPAGVAAEWAATVPRAELEVIAREAPSRDLAVFAAAARTGLSRLLERD